MTTKTLSGTYTAGYTLSAGYSSLDITPSGAVRGVPGARGAYNGAGNGGAGGPGGIGVTVPFAAMVDNHGGIVGGRGGNGGAGVYGGGYAGTGGAALSMASGGSLFNFGSIVGGRGGVGGRAENWVSGDIILISHPRGAGASRRPAWRSSTPMNAAPPLVDASTARA